MRLIFLGSGAFAVPTLRRLAEGEHELPLVLTQPARPSGRGRRVAPTAVREAADALALPVLEVENVNEGDVVERIRSLGADVGVVVAFGQKLGPEVRSAVRGGLINAHASLLPKYRGAAPINWAIVHGEQRTGCTVFKIVDRMDAGPILTSRWTDTKPQETAGELHDRLAGIAVDAVQAAVALFEGGAIPDGAPQDEAEATKAPKLRKADGRIDFHLPARNVANLICGMTPWPGASAHYESKAGRWERITLTRARMAEDPIGADLPPGTIDERRYVATADGTLEILELKPSSGRLMTWPEYVNGRHVEPGDRLASPE